MCWDPGVPPQPLFYRQGESQAAKVWRAGVGRARSELGVACALCQQTVLTLRVQLSYFPPSPLRVGSQDARVLLLVLVWVYLLHSSSTAQSLSPGVSFPEGPK